MKRIFTLYLFILFCLILQAQEELYERVYVHTDKTCYLAGEEVWLKFYTIDTHFRPSSFSKVGYIEISNTERPKAQLKLALDNGSGSGKVKIPTDAPSGIYELTGYTRYMRNEGEKVFFRKSIAVINTFRVSDSDPIELADSAEIYPKGKPATTENIHIKTSQSNYNTRQLVELTINRLPDEVSDLTVSVSRNDSLVTLPPLEESTWRKQVTATPGTFSGKWIPEYEGHIICGQIESPTGETLKQVQNEPISADIAFVGKDIRYVQGQVESGGNTLFYTSHVYGTNDVVAAAWNINGEPFRMNILSPFSEKLPQNLPSLKLYRNKKRLLERSIGIQLQQVTVLDSLDHAIPLQSCYGLQPYLNYNLDEYTRFNTMTETFVEFVRSVIIRKVNGKRRLRVLKEGEKRFNIGNTLVLLDGVPIHDHEDILKYDPRLVKKIEIYNGRYGFGGEVFECMISLTTQRGDLPSIQLSDDSRLTVYECPQLPVTFKMPEYKDATDKKSRRPDFRHTLYWNPSVETEAGIDTTLSFYTSDLEGEFKVVVEGFTLKGELIRGEVNFHVKK